MGASVIETMETSVRDEAARGDLMRTPDEVAAMLALKGLGWGAKRIAREFGTCPKTVRRYLRDGGWTGYGERVGRRLWRGWRHGSRSG